MSTEPLFRRVPPMHRPAPFAAAGAGLRIAISPHCLAAVWLDRGRLASLTDVTAVSPRNYGVTCAPPVQVRLEAAGFTDWLRGCFSP